MPFEITTLRKDIETDGRHAVVGFTKSWAADARRRDFTINALYADVNGKIYEYVGGLEDLEQNRLRFVGEARQTMHEDYLRVLRYFRFWARMGAEEVAIDVEQALPSVIPFLKKLSFDRRRNEMFKIVTGPRAEVVLRLMKRLNVLNDDLLSVPFSKRQRRAIRAMKLEKMLATFGFSGYKEGKGETNEKIKK